MKKHTPLEVDEILEFRSTQKVTYAMTTMEDGKRISLDFDLCGGLSVSVGGEVVFSTMQPSAAIDKYNQLLGID